MSCHCARSLDSFLPPPPCISFPFLPVHCCVKAGMLSDALILTCLHNQWQSGCTVYTQQNKDNRVFFLAYDLHSLPSSLPLRLTLSHPFPAVFLHPSSPSPFLEGPSHDPQSSAHMPALLSIPSQYLSLPVLFLSSLHPPFPVPVPSTSPLHSSTFPSLE